jgi:hypothetical protein
MFKKNHQKSQKKMRFVLFLLSVLCLLSVFGRGDHVKKNQKHFAKKHYQPPKQHKTKENILFT